ncbi:MAG: hypothetical protein ACK4RF_13090 [Cyclobacteriaceae bacterium]
MAEKKSRPAGGIERKKAKQHVARALQRLVERKRERTSERERETQRCFTVCDIIQHHLDNAACWESDLASAKQSKELRERETEKTTLNVQPRTKSDEREREREREAERMRKR